MAILQPSRWELRKIKQSQLRVQEGTYFCPIRMSRVHDGHGGVWISPVSYCDVAYEVPDSGKDGVERENKVVGREVSTIGSQEHARCKYLEALGIVGYLFFTC